MTVATQPSSVAGVNVSETSLPVPYSQAGSLEPLEPIVTPELNAETIGLVGSLAVLVLFCLS